jgi:leucyl-tRNA synthetase
LPIQINGKLRATISIPVNTDEQVAVELALNNTNVITHLNNQPVKKHIYIKGKILNLII